MEPIVVRIDLPRPVATAVRTIRVRELLVVRIRSEGGVEGAGFTVGGADVLALVDTLASILLGADADAIDTHWARLVAARSDKPAATHMRAVSALDVALWDLRCRRRDEPLWRLLGSRRPSVRCYGTGGSYLPDGGNEGLADQVRTFRDAGFAAVKIKLARHDVEDDVRRAEIAHEAFGDAGALMVDANTGYSGRPEAARRAAAAFAELGVVWLEEPFRPGEIEAAKQLRTVSDVALAGGEQATGPEEAEMLIRESAVDVLQPVVAAVGGVTGWLRAVETAGRARVPIAPHAFHDVHVQLAAASERVTWLEYFPAGNDVYPFDRLMARTAAPRDGMLEASDAPGVGLDFDWESIAHHRRAR